MASFALTQMLLQFIILAALLHSGSAGSRRLFSSNNVSGKTQQGLTFGYHNGPLLTGKVSVNLIWYGNFKPSQRAIVTDFIDSLASSKQMPNAVPSVATWWKGMEMYYQKKKKKASSSSSSPVLSLGTQALDDRYSLGKSLTSRQISQLAAKGGQSKISSNSINVVLTASDVAVEGFCSSRCGTHSISDKTKLAYIWVGNSETQCPGFCAWPFHKPIYGPQGPPLVSPNNDVGLDGLVISLAGLLAGTATNLDGNGYFQGPKEAPLEAASACTGVYAKGAYPGYPGDLLVDSTTGASYNARGVNGRKYLLPALFDPSSATCSTLV